MVHSSEEFYHKRGQKNGTVPRGASGIEIFLKDGVKHHKQVL